MALVHIRYWGRGFACGLEPRTQFRLAYVAVPRVPTCIACIANEPVVLRTFAQGTSYRPTNQPIYEEVL